MDQNSESTPVIKSHSKVGIASLIIGLGPLCILLCYIAFLYIYAPNVDLRKSLDLPIPLVLLVVLASGSILGVVAIILAVVALFQKEHKKLLPILGILIALFGCRLVPFAFFTLFIFTS